MADTAGTLKKTYFRPGSGGNPGVLEFTLTYSSTTYVDAGNLNLSSLKLPINVNRISSVRFSVESSTAAYMVVYTPAATPTLAVLGTLSLFTATGTKASGSLTLVLRGFCLLAGDGGITDEF